MNILVQEFTEWYHVRLKNRSISHLPLFREKNTEKIIRLSVTPVVPPCQWKLRGLFTNVSANQRQSERSWWLRVPGKKTDEKFSGAHSWQPSADTLIDLTALPLLLQEPVCCPGGWEVMLRFLDPPPPPPPCAPCTQPEVWACALPYLGQPSPCALSGFAPQLLISALNLCLVKSFSSSVDTKISKLFSPTHWSSTFSVCTPDSRFLFCDKQLQAIGNYIECLLSFTVARVDGSIEGDTHYLHIVYLEGVKSRSLAET